MIPEALNTLGFFCCAVGAYGLFYMAFTGTWEMWRPAAALLAVGTAFFVAARRIER